MILRRLSIAVVLALATIAVVPAFINPDWSVERAHALGGDADMLFQRAADLSTWHEWFRFPGHDRAEPFLLRGEPTSPGGAIEAADGSVELDAVDPKSRSLDLTVRLGDAFSALCAIRFEPRGPDAEVVVKLEGTIDGYLNRYAKLFFVPRLDASFSESITRLLSLERKSG